MHGRKHDPRIVRALTIGWSPSYAFAVADLDGDGLCEFLSCPIGQGLLQAVDLAGRVRWRYHFASPDRIGEMPLVAADFDGDGLPEIILPDEPPSTDEIGLVALRGDGTMQWKITLPVQTKWYLENQVMPLETPPPGGYVALDRDYGTRRRAGIPAVRNSVLNLVAARLDGPAAPPLLVACVRGGRAFALDAGGHVRWHRDSLGDEPAHYAFAGDLDGDGNDEIVMSSSARQPAGWEPGTMYVLSGQGALLWKKQILTEMTVHDVHIDDAVIAPVVPESDGRKQLMTASGGCLFDADGTLRWTLESDLEHGQWVTVADLLPAFAGLEIVLTQYHVVGAPVTLATADGVIRWHYRDWNAQTMLTRACCVDWHGDGQRQIVVGEQAPYHRTDAAPRSYDITLLSATGACLGKLPFQDQKRPDWYYNGENSAGVADLDGDGREEFYFPTMDGRLLIVADPTNRPWLD